LLCFFYGLNPALGVEFFKKAGNVGFYCVGRYKKMDGNFLVAVSKGHQFEHFQFALADVALLDFGIVPDKWLRDDFFFD